MLASRKATSLLTSGANLTLLQSAQNGLFAKMGNNIVQGMKPGAVNAGNIAQISALGGLPCNLVK